MDYFNNFGFHLVVKSLSDFLIAASINQEVDKHPQWPPSLQNEYHFQGSFTGDFSIAPPLESSSHLVKKHDLSGNLSGQIIP